MIFSILIIPGLIASAILDGWACLYPESFKQQFNQDQFIQIIITLNIIIFILYLLLCIKSKFNWSDWWLSLLLMIPGLFLVSYSTYLLGQKGTFYGIELGTVENHKITEFPFTIRFPQLKGLILLIFGIWCIFQPTFELTFVTCAYVFVIFVHILFETYKTN